MALRDAILAALAYGRLSGYDLAKDFDVSVSNYWAATPQQLYRELDGMQADGLIEATVVQQDKRPAKRLFSLTDEGRAALHRFTQRQPKPLAIRDELMVQVEAMDFGDVPSVGTNVRDKLAVSNNKLQRYEQARSSLLAGRTEAAYLGQENHVGHYLTLARGIAFEQENIRWCELVLGVLADRNAVDEPGRRRHRRPQISRHSTGDA
jgi:DNA-binding PadR family transcriptional regulator